jgi:hypothetical protein
MVILLLGVPRCACSNSPTAKPAETVELDLDVVDPLHVAEMTSAERALLVARVLEVHPHLAELVPLRLRPVPEV